MTFMDKSLSFECYLELVFHVTPLGSERSKLVRFSWIRNEFQGY